MKLKNDQIAIEVSSHGAELLSLQKAGREYLWNGDGAYWNRHAPILFPAVGKPFENTVRIDGKARTMKQHGFARDREFEEVGCGRMRMVGEGQLEEYPYRFELEVAYRIEANTVEVGWTVRNMDKRDMHFQIGAHPGFMMPDYDAGDGVHGYVRYLDSKGRPVSPVMVSALEDGNRVLMAEGCTHHRQCNDIGTVKIPRWLRQHTGKALQIDTCSGREFPEDLSPYSLVIHCGGCMLTETVVGYRMRTAMSQGVPFTNYGIVIARITGILDRSLEPLKEVDG